VADIRNAEAVAEALVIVLDEPIKNPVERRVVFSMSVYGEGLYRSEEGGTFSPEA
jgi:hypothetical protein